MCPPGRPDERSDGASPSRCGSTPRSESFQDLAEAHEILEHSICDALERAADELPEINAPLYLKLVGELRTLRSRQHIEELEDAFEQLAPPQQDALSPAFSRLAHEERTDADIALELMDALTSAAHDSAPNAEALGYLMRGYFENRRRHLAWRRRAFWEPVAKARHGALR